MTFADIHRKLAQGETFEVVFTSRIEELETMFDTGCKAVLVGTGQVCAYDTDTCGEFVFDFSKYEDYNKNFYQPNYYDKHHKPCLYVYQTSYYPTKPVETVWFMFDTMVADFMTIIEKES